METPVIIVNFKAYEILNAKGDLAFARICEDVAQETGASVAVVPQASALAAVASAISIPVLAQHVDAVEAGSHTGHVTPEAVKASRAVGTLLNHSERKIHAEHAAYVVQRCRQLALETVACADDLDEVRGMASLGPDFVAIEPPELIGGDVSVTTANPDVVEGAVEAVQATAPDVQVLCGAGVKTRDDVAKALEFGTVGVLLASGVIKARDPREALADLATGL